MLILAFRTALAGRSSFAEAPAACGPIAEPLLRHRAASAQNAGRRTVTGRTPVFHAALMGFMGVGVPVNMVGGPS